LLAPEALEKAVALVEKGRELGTNSWCNLADVQSRNCGVPKAVDLTRRDLASTTSPFHVILNLDLARHMCYRA